VKFPWNSYEIPIKTIHSSAYPMLRSNPICSLGAFFSTTRGPRIPQRRPIWWTAPFPLAGPDSWGNIWRLPRLWRSWVSRSIVTPQILAHIIPKKLGFIEVYQNQTNMEMIWPLLPTKSLAHIDPTSRWLWWFTQTNFRWRWFDRNNKGGFISGWNWHFR
jgi:hypothetical protein